MLQIPLLLIGSAVACLAQVSGPPPAGSCASSSSSEPSTDYNFDEFHSEDEGYWEAVYVPDTPFFRNLTKLYLSSKSVGDGIYHNVMRYKTKAGIRGVFADEAATYGGNGIENAVATDGQVYKIRKILYIPGEAYYYHVCMVDGSIQPIDYRYVLAHGSMSAETTRSIKDKDAENGFKGSLLQLSGFGINDDDGDD